VPASSPASCWPWRALPARPHRLLFTALNNQFWNSSLSEPMASLAGHDFQVRDESVRELAKLAWAGVFLITLAVLGLNIAARIFTRAR
jgi:phosphate transport system permease protein